MPSNKLKIDKEIKVQKSILKSEISFEIKNQLEIKYDCKSRNFA